jgi:N-acyl-L-homoserine lactone synthetase
LTRYRRKVFIERLGWELRCSGDSGLKQFDRNDAVNVVTRSDDGEVTGTARLLPTRRPYRLGEVCPELFHGSRLLLAEVWELSRLTALDFSEAAPTALSKAQLSSSITVDLLRKAATCAAERGAKRLVTVSTLGIERLLRNAGFKTHRAGPPVMVSGKPTFACWIDI